MLWILLHYYPACIHCLSHFSDSYNDTIDWAHCLVCRCSLILFSFFYQSMHALNLASPKSCLFFSLLFYFISCLYLCMLWILLHIILLVLIASLISAIHTMKPLIKLAVFFFHYSLIIFSYMYRSMRALNVVSSISCSFFFLWFYFHFGVNPCIHMCWCASTHCSIYISVHVFAHCSSIWLACIWC